ncbi:ArsR/SmtB family transcription factor [Lysinibacillus sp. JNUCC 51]|uniref:ArsR/SmtB family transcription factor n=1 Tax=Lysinibacillus sp. JNUCC-51 TaxID=2792479 RepID=UPI0019382492|nr:ArsR family transcriptional regulator [Lysinibacillus sp. JNUCC-51]
MQIIHSEKSRKKYDSQLAREFSISRPLLYLHLQKLEEANIVSSDMELLESVKAAKYYTLNPFNVLLNELLISDLISTLTVKNKQ